MDLSPKRVGCRHSPKRSTILALIDFILAAVTSSLTKLVSSEKNQNNGRVVVVVYSRLFCDIYLVPSRYLNSSFKLLALSVA